jgi:two-component system CheB/CheR fusion protein
MTSATTVEAVLDFLKRNRGFDFTGYKRSSLERRIVKRMREVGLDDYGDYLDHLEVAQEEFEALFNTILINVTAFFRDPAVWGHLRTEVLPTMLAARPPENPIRVWVTGCASGEEAYTAAMVLVQLLGEDAFAERVKIYATDVDEDALQAARQASYTAKQMEPVPPELRERCFMQDDDRWVFRAELRRAVIFGRNDLVQDAPISRIDLLLCRNTLMYFNAETQAQILRRFHFALRQDGVMVLGRSEMLISHGDRFGAVDLTHRIFNKVGSRRQRLRVPFAFDGSADRDPDGGVDGAAPDALVDGAFDAAPIAQVVLDDAGLVAGINGAARELFGLGADDLGRPLQDLELSYRPVELRSQLDRVRAERRPLALPTVQAVIGDRERVFDVLLTPLLDDGDLRGVSVGYADVTSVRALQDDLARAHRDLERTYEELQATVEELETTNEELQSTNEELETTNEELQSTNEELEATNDELRARTAQLDEDNAFLETILGSMGVAVAVLDAAQTVRVWNRDAEELWGLRAAEVDGQLFLGLDMGLPVEALRAEIRGVLASEGDGDGPRRLTLDAVNRRGRALRCQVTCLPLARTGRRVSGVILLMEPLSPDAVTPPRTPA